MDILDLPTKKNLILAKNGLALCKKGHSLLDKKRQVLTHEWTAVKKNLVALEKTTKKAYLQMRDALGQVGNVVYKSAGNFSARVGFGARQIMGVEVPTITFYPPTERVYMLAGSTEKTDEAYRLWVDAHVLLAELAQERETFRRLGVALQKTQKRVAALEHILIPKYETRVRRIREQLEERERDTLTRVQGAREFKQE